MNKTCCFASSLSNSQAEVLVVHFLPHPPPPQVDKHWCTGNPPDPQAVLGGCKCLCQKQRQDWFTCDIVVLDGLGAGFASITHPLPRPCWDRQWEAKISERRLSKRDLGERGEGGPAWSLPVTLPVSLSSQPPTSSNSVTLGRNNFLLHLLTHWPSLLCHDKTALHETCISPGALQCRWQPLVWVRPLNISTVKCHQLN